MARNLDAQYLATLQAYYRNHRALSSMARIAKLLGFASNGGVFELVWRPKTAAMSLRVPTPGAEPRKKSLQRRLLYDVRASWREPVEEQAAAGNNMDVVVARAPERKELALPELWQRGRRRPARWSSDPRLGSLDGRFRSQSMSGQHPRQFLRDFFRNEERASTILIGVAVGVMVVGFLVAIAAMALLR